MKTTEQWMEIINQRGATTQPAGTLKLIADIQDDAIDEASSIVLDYKYQKKGSINYNMGMLAGNISALRSTEQRRDPMCHPDAKNAPQTAQGACRGIVVKK